MSGHGNPNSGPERCAAPRPPGDRLILLDRDGVINADSAAFIRTVAEWHPLPGALDAIANLYRHGFRIGICTNQSGIGRGLLSEIALLEIHSSLVDALAGLGARIDGWRYCPHLPEKGCDCRKPRPGMLRSLMQELGIGPAATCFVGDSLRDMEAAQAAGCEPVLVRTGHGLEVEDQARRSGVTRVYDDLAGFALAEIDCLQHRPPHLQQ